MADGYISQIKTLDNKTYLLRDSEKTDEKVNQTSNAENKEFPIILKNTNNTTDETAGVKYAGGVSVNPSDKTVTATEFIGNIKANRVKPTIIKEWNDTSFYGANISGQDVHDLSTFWMLSVKPDSWYEPWIVRFKITTTCPAAANYYSVTYCMYSGRADGIVVFNWNERYDHAHYYTNVRTLKRAGFDAGLGHAIGINLYASNNYTNANYYRSFKLEYYDCDNCTVTILDNPIKWANWPNGTTTNYNGNNNANAVDRGLQESGDANSYDLLQMSNTYLKNGSFRFPGISLFGYDREGHAQPFSLYQSDYTSYTASISNKATRLYNTNGIDWTRGIHYNSSGGSWAGNADMNISIRLAQSAIDLRYTDNCVSTANTTLSMISRKPVYIRGTLDDNGLFYVAPLDVTYNNATYCRTWTQDIPTEVDNYVYWLIGYPYATSAYQINLYIENPLYWYHNGRFEEYKPASTVTWADITNKPSTATSWPNWNQIQQSGANSIEEGTSDVTANTEILTSYASNNGFADSNAVGKVYRRDASKVVNATLVKAALGTNATHNNTFLRKDGTWATVLITSSDIPVTLTRAQLISTEQMAFTNWLPKYGSGTAIPAKTMALFADGLAIKSPATSADAGWIRVTGTDETDTVLEIATSDDANKANSEKIVVRQYNSSSAQHEVILLGKIGDVYGATSFPVQVSAPKFIGTLQGNADSATTANYLTTYAYGASGDTNIAALQKAFPDIPKSVATAVRLQHGTHSMAIGWFLSGYNIENAYGGWFISDYATPSWVGISNGTWTSSHFLLKSHVIDNLTSSTSTDTPLSAKQGYLLANGSARDNTKLPLSGGQMTGPLTWKDSTALPQASSLSYVLGIDAFASGGTTKWIGIDGLRTSLGLSNALHFIGQATTALADGDTGTPTISGKTYSTKTAGDVVLGKDDGREYVWTGSAWEILGQDASTTYDSGTAATNTWVSRIQQASDRTITVTTAALDTSGTWSGNAATATTATNLANNPSIQTASNSNQITITAGGKTSSAYTIPYATYAGSATSATTATYIKCTDTRSTALNPTDLNAAQGIRFDFKAKGTINLTATDAYAGVMSFRPYASNSDWSGGNAHQLAFNSEGLHWRNGGASWGNWYQILDSNNTTTGTNNTATLTWNTTYTIAKINGTDIKFTTMTKPTYAFSDLTSHPTTLSGYGITDAASSNHSHTLKIGNESLSVSTSEQTWSVHNILFNSTSIGTATSWDQTTPGAYYVASGAAFTGTGHPGTNQEAPYSYGGLYVLRAGNGGAAQIYISHNASNTTNKAYGIRYRSGWNVINNAEETHWVSWATILDDKNYSLFAWKRPASITTGQVLISNGTDGTTTTRAILNNTSKSALGWNSAGNTNADNLRFMTVNTLAYWNGAYSGTTSNLSVLGTVTTGTWNASVIGAAYGGTGQNTLQKSANALINALDTGSSDLTANDYVITQYVGGGTTTTSYHRRPASKVINATLVKGALGTDSSTTNQWLNKKGEWSTPTAAEVGAITKLNSSTDNAIVRFDGTTGAIQDSEVIINDSNVISGYKTLKYTTRIYPFVASGERSKWYKITFPYYDATTTSSAKWFMNSFDLHFGGGYSSNASGIAHVTFYWTRAANNGAWAVSQQAAFIEGTLVNKIGLYYRIAEPGILYVNNTSNSYNGIWLDNLYVDDTSPSLDWSTTTITNVADITESTSPKLSDYTKITTSYLYNDGGTLKTDNNFEGKYIKGTWLYTSAATAKTSATKLATIASDNFIYYITPANALKSAIGTTTIGAEKTPIYWDGSGFAAGTTLKNLAYKDSLTYSDVGAAAEEHGTHVTTATVQSALGISSSGSASKALTQKGTFVEFGTSNLTIGNTSSTAMAGNTNVNNVTQTVTTSSYSNWRPLLVGDSNGAADTFTVTTKTGATYGVHSIKVQPSSGTIKATTFQGNLTGNVTGNASTVGGHTVEADVPSDAIFTDTTYTFDGTYNASSNKAATVSTVTNAINALDGGTIGTGSATKTITSLSQTNGNVSATFSDITFPVSSVAGLSGAIAASNLTEALGLSKALHFVGITTTDMTGGTATNHTYTGTPAGISDYTPIVGDVVINSTKQDEWVCTAVSGTTYTWERLGSDTSYKIVQSAVSDPTAASTTSTTFIDTISQDANGVISATKKTLPNYAGSDSAGGSANTVKQTPTTGTYYNWRKLLVGTSNNSSDSFTVSSDTSGSVYQVNTISVKPAEGILKASSFIGQFTGTGDLVLKTTTADSPDIVWKYGNTTNEQEQARIWMGTGGSTKWAPQYRCYKQDGTQLYNGTLVLGDGTGASGTWAITASGNLPLTGGRLTGTLSLRPTSGEGGQINISASEENTSQTGIAIDQYNSTLRIFGIASADGTITGTGTSLIIHPYDATMEGDYRVKFKHIIATKQMIVKSGLVYYNDTTDSANDTKILAKSGMFFSDGIAFANPGLSTANDVGWIRVKGTTENNTELEIATGDDGDNATTGERIVVRQYKSSSSREAVLLEKGTGATTFPVSLSAPQLTLTSTSAVSHITFSRGGWNYITMPENDASVLSVGFGELGNNTNQRLVIFKTGTVRPGLNGGQDLGDNEHKWNHVYGINFYGTFHGTAASANQLNRISIANGSSLNNFIPDTNNGYLRYTWVNGANAGNDDDSNNPGILNKPKGTNAFGLFTFKTADNWAGQIFVSTNNLPGIYWRNGLTTNGSLVANWTRLANGNANIYYGESTTAAATAIKDVTCLHYHTLNVGDILVVKFTNANSANEPQLNVNSTGNKLIRASYSGGIVSLSSVTQIRNTCMFIYDGTYWIQMSTDCVKQMVTTSSESVWRSVMVSASNNASESFTPDQMFAKTYVAHNVKFQASTGTLRATKFKGTEFKLEYEHADKAYMTWNNTDQSIDFIFV